MAQQIACPDNRWHVVYRSWIVWFLRILIGALFIVSGLSKCIDIWGFSYKIEEYFLVWNVTVPHTLYVISAMALSVGEFLLGSMLALGCYKRSAVWLLLAIMCGMLPLSAYIFIADPVADCGCFGDFWVISNGATFLKNILITAALIYLAFYNRKIDGVYGPYWQWIVGLCCFVYAVAVCLWGYNVQPLVDFRSFPVGTNLSVDDEDVDDVEFEFIYEKNGKEQSFSASDLPDSTWTFVDRHIVSGHLSESTTLSILDRGEDVTEDVITAEQPLLIITVPDYHRAGISYTYVVNELSAVMDSIGGSLIEIVAMPDDYVGKWADLSMATYQIYTAEPTVIKEMARGIMGAVMVIDGKIVWKRTLSSLNVDDFRRSALVDKHFESMAVDGGRLLKQWTLALLILLLAIFASDKFVDHIRAIRKKKKQTLPKSDLRSEDSDESSDAQDQAEIRAEGSEMTGDAESKNQ